MRCCFTATAAGWRSRSTVVFLLQSSIQYDFQACFVFVSPLAEQQASVVVTGTSQTPLFTSLSLAVAFLPLIRRRFQLRRVWSLLFFLFVLFCVGDIVRRFRIFPTTSAAVDTKRPSHLATDKRGRESIWAGEEVGEAAREFKQL